MAAGLSGFKAGGVEERPGRAASSSTVSPSNFCFNLVRAALVSLSSAETLSSLVAAFTLSFSSGWFLDALVCSALEDIVEIMWMKADMRCLRCMSGDW